MSPSKITVKKLIGDKFLQNKWNTDVRDTLNNHFTIVIYGRGLGQIHPNDWPVADPIKKFWSKFTHPFRKLDRFELYINLPNVLELSNLQEE